MASLKQDEQNLYGIETTTTKNYTEATSQQPTKK